MGRLHMLHTPRLITLLHCGLGHIESRRRLLLFGRVGHFRNPIIHLFHMSIIAEVLRGVSRRQGCYGQTGRSPNPQNGFPPLCDTSRHLNPQRANLDAASKVARPFLLATKKHLSESHITSPTASTALARHRTGQRFPPPLVEQKGGPLLALFGHPTRSDECPLSGTKRT